MPDDAIPSLDKKTDAWNVAQGYTYAKILSPLVEMDKLVKIARYGAEHIEQSSSSSDEVISANRLEAINRLIDTLKLLIENSNFAIKQKSRDQWDQIRDTIKRVESVIKGIARPIQDQRTGESHIAINEDHFNLCLDKLRGIKERISTPLNDASLIFPASDEIDLDKIKEQLVFGG